jgi:hypothetical protein
MHKSVVLKNYSIVSLHENIEVTSYFYNGSLASFVVIDENNNQKLYSYFSDLKNGEVKLIEGYYEKELYLNFVAGIDNIKYEDVLKSKFFFNHTKIGDLVTVQRAEFSDEFPYSFCWKKYEITFNGHNIVRNKEILIDNDVIPVSSVCDQNLLNSHSYLFYQEHILWAVNSPIDERKQCLFVLGNILFAINNVDINIYDSFTSTKIPETLKALQKDTYPNSNQNYHLEELKDYKEFLNALVSYTTEVENSRRIIENGNELDKGIAIALTLHPKVLIGLNVNDKIDILSYLANEKLSSTIDKLPYENLVVNLVYSFDQTNILADADIFLENLIDDNYDIIDYSLKNNANETEFEINRQSKTLYEVLYDKMSESWEITKGLSSLVNYILPPSLETAPVMTRYSFVNGVYRIWYNSKFNPYKNNYYHNEVMSLVSENENTIFKYTTNPATRYTILGQNAVTQIEINKSNGPSILNFKSSKQLGLFIQYFIFQFTGNKKICILTRDWDSIRTPQQSEIPPILGKREWDPYGYYDIYQPVTFIDYSSESNIPILTVDNENPDESFSNFNSVIPVFYLKYFADNISKINSETWIFRGIDVISIFAGGAGLISRLSHIRHLSKFGVAMTIVAGVELTAGATSFVLSFIDSCDNSEFCKKLKTVVMWMEIGSLGVDGLSSLAKSSAAKKFIQEVNENGIPNSFDTVHGQEFIAKVNDNLAEGVDLAQIIAKAKEEIFTLIKPSLQKRIDDSIGTFSKKHFKQQFTDINIKTFIENCLTLELSNPKMIEDFIIMACRGDALKRSTYQELLTQVNYYRKVILSKGFPSGFLSLNDFKLFSNKAKNFFEENSIFNGKVIEYRVQGSVLKKRNATDPPDPLNTPFLEKANTNPPPPFIINSPDDLDVDLIMSQANAAAVTNNMRRYWKQKQFAQKKRSKLWFDYQNEIDKIDKALKKGIIHKELIFLNEPGDIYQLYRSAIKQNGQDIFQAVSAEGVIEIGFAIIIKGKGYDILPNMPFKY